MSRKRVLVMGATGMLGHTFFNQFCKLARYDVFGTARSILGLEHFFTETERKRIRVNVDADNFDTVVRAMASIQPDIVINCIGLIKQLPIGGDPLSAITINAQLPHRISLVCKSANSRLIHLSTDCVFDGQIGMYTESDIPSPTDLYGRTKLLGEVAYPHCVTLRTSIIGHELKGRLGLIDWFLSQENDIRGFTHAIYSGFPTIEMARIITDFVIPNDELNGLYQVSSNPISKYDLLRLVAKQYNKKIEIKPYGDFHCDRSLDSSRFRIATGYSPPSWEKLVESMHDDFMRNERR